MDEHLDGITELGIALRQPIPRGEEFLEWVADEETQVRCTDALLEAGFSWEEIRGLFFDLTRGHWLPSVDQLQHTYRVVKA